MFWFWLYLKILVFGSWLFGFLEIDCLGFFLCVLQKPKRWWFEGWGPQPRKSGGPKGGGQKWGPEGWGPQGWGPKGGTPKTTKTPKRRKKENSVGGEGKSEILGPPHRAPALQTPQKFHARTPREGRKEQILWRERGKKSAQFFAPPLRGPTLSTQHKKKLNNQFLKTQTTNSQNQNL